MSVVPASTVLTVLPTSEARVELPKVLRRFRQQGASAEPVVFGAQRRPEAVMIPFQLYQELLPVIEDLEIAQLVRDRVAEGPAFPLADVATSLGLDPDEYR